ncbi:MAG: tetratricopeptide repeat protein, partial [Muribaculaceae bacterium]|nr:tetratricopeptide repeat protein [Muribaculaceae bacterium]
ASTNEVYDIYQRALKINQNDTDALLGMAQLKMSVGEITEARAFLQKIMRLGDRNYIDASLMLGDMYATDDDISEAAEYYQKAAKKSKRDNRAIRRLIDLYEDNNMHEIAEQWREWL